MSGEEKKVITAGKEEIAMAARRAATRLKLKAANAKVEAGRLELEEAAAELEFFFPEPELEAAPAYRIPTPHFFPEPEPELEVAKGFMTGTRVGVV